MSDKRQKPKARKGGDFTKAGRNSRKGGQRAGQNGEKARVLYPVAISNSGAPNAGATHRAAVSAALAKAALEASCQHASELARAYANEKLGEQRRWDKPTADQAVSYLRYLFFGKPEDAARASSLEDNTKAQIRSYFVHYTRDKGLSGTFGQKATWFPSTEAMPLSRLENPDNMDPNSKKALAIAFREKQMELARNLIGKENLHGVAAKAAALFFELYPYVVNGEQTRAQATNDLVRERLPEAMETRYRAVDKGLICAKQAAGAAFQQLKQQVA